MKNPKSIFRANKGQARILETIIAATIIFIVFTASSFFVSTSNSTNVQERTDLDKLGYNVLSRLTESGTIEATIEQSPPLTIQLKAFLQHSLPSSLLFKFSVMTWDSSSSKWVASFPTQSNSDEATFLNLTEVSSTPMIYTSTKNPHNVYYLVLVLANSGQGAN